MIQTTQKNERRLRCVLKMIISSTDLTPEIKFVCRQCINQTIADVREKQISSYCDLIDYIREKANQRIDCEGLFAPEQKAYLKCWTYICTELAKLRRCNQKSFWSRKMHGRIKASLTHAPYANTQKAIYPWSNSASIRDSSKTPW